MAHEEITQGPKQGELPLGDDVEVEVDEEAVEEDIAKDAIETTQMKHY